MPRQPPHPPAVQGAVKEVIRSNRSDGHYPTRFVQVTHDGNASELSAICERLIFSQEAFSSMAQAVVSSGGLLFLEDLVAAYGYGLSQAAVNMARERAKALDGLAGGPRWQRAERADVEVTRERPKTPAPKIGRLAEELLRIRRDRGDALFWPWLDDLEGKPADKKSANKFLPGAILDWQIPTDRAWNNAQRLAEEILGDPDDLWESIVAVPLAEWNSKWKTYSLHRFPLGHERIWTIGRGIAIHYNGDARMIWREQKPATVLDCLD